MKNIKRLMALTIILAVTLSSVAFAGVYSDVSDSSNNSEAIIVMSALGLLQGYEDGTFGPDKTITRAEFAAVMVRALGMEQQANGAYAQTKFTDVPADEWYAGYIQIANQQGVIEGNGDGTFEPEVDVTYEQAVKMIVCALGYAPKFYNVPDAYPSSYLAQANADRITVGVSGKIGDKASRSTVARLVYNALDVPLMEQTSFGTDIEYSVPTNYKTLLSNNLKVAKVDATLVAQYFNKYDCDKVKIDITAVDDCYKRADSQFEKGEKDFYFEKGLELKKGYNCVAYIDFNDDDAVIKAMIPKTNKNKTVDITDKQAKDGYIDLTENKLGYYKVNSDTNSSTTDVKLEADVKAFVNMDSSETDIDNSFVSDYKSGKFKKITLIDNDNNNKYDYIYVTKYTAGVVDEISSRSYKLTFSAGDAQTLRLDPDAEDYTYIIRDGRGNEIEFEDIKEGDVINITKSVDGSDAFYDISVTGRQLKGTVSEKLSNGNVIIDGEEYSTYGVSVSAGDTGVFIIDKYDRILKYNLDGGNRKFGLAYKGYIDFDGVEDSAKLLMFTSEGKYVTYNFAKNVKLYGKTVKNSEIELNNGIYDTVKFAMYVTNSSDQITEIYYDNEISAKDSNYKLTEASNVYYNGNAEKLGSYYITDSTKIIANENSTLLNKDKADFELASSSILVDDDDTVYSYKGVYNKNKDFVFLVLNAATPKPNKVNKAMYVTAVGSTVDSDGASAVSVTGMVDGERESFIVTSDTKGYSIDGTSKDTSKIKKGDVIQYVGGKEATSVRFIVLAEDYKNYVDGTAVKIGSFEGAKENGFLTYGKADEYRNGCLTIEGKDYSFRAATCGMLVRLDDSGNVSKLYTNNIDITSAETEKDCIDDNDDIVIIYKYDDEEVAVVIIDTKNDTDF